MSTNRPVVDAHGDTLLRLAKDQKRLADEGGHINLDSLQRSPVGLIFAALYTPQKEGDRRIRLLLHMVHILEQELRDHADFLRPVRFREDLEGEGCGVLLSVEGLDLIGTDIWLLDVFHALGVRSALLTWNERNALADGAMDQGSKSGLSNAGRAVVKRMEELGWLPDVSHLAESSFWGLVEAAEGPIIASHSNAHAVFAHPRNLSDDQIRAVARKGGVVGLNFFPQFLTEGEATLDDMFRHLDRLLEIGGEDAVGFGSDFDGIETTPLGVDDIAAFPVVLERLHQSYGDTVAGKIEGANFRRVLGQVLPAAGTAPAETA